MAKLHPVLTDPGCHTAEPVGTHFFCGFPPQSREGGSVVWCIVHLCARRPAWVQPQAWPIVLNSVKPKLWEVQGVSYPAPTEPAESV